MGNRIRVIVDNRLHLDVRQVPRPIADIIAQRCIVDNQEKLEKVMRGLPGADELPDEFILAELDGDWLSMPRGFALRLKRLLRIHGYKVIWIDRTYGRRGVPYGPDEFSYRAHQPAAVYQMRRHRQGIYQAPTASGKTVAILGFLWEVCPRKTIILVDRIELMDQWVERAKEHLGEDIDIGTVGGGKWDDDHRIVVAMVQSLWSRRDQLIECGWFGQWDCMVLDECHHVTADTFNFIVDLFPARWRIGASATPDKTGLFEIALLTMGEVFHEDNFEELHALGLVVKPIVEIVETNFTYRFWGDHYVKKGKPCRVPGCRLSRKKDHGHRNNFQKMLSALVHDEARNDRIAEYVVAFQGNAQLIVSSQTTHLDMISLSLQKCLMPHYVFTGREKKAERKEILRALDAANGNFVMLSTLAGEALDIPVLNVVHLAMPGKNHGAAYQKFGRAMRVVEGKDEALILDYLDYEVDVFMQQFYKRRKAYTTLGLEVSGGPAERQTLGML